MINTDGAGFFCGPKCDHKWQQMFFTWMACASCGRLFPCDELFGSFKRIRNIIKDNKETEVNPDRLTEPAEQQLFTALAGVREKALPLIWDREYRAALLEMLEMKGPVDRFFDEVMVMANDEAVRQNRLNLLTALGELVLQVGDISKMHVEKEQENNS